MTTVFFFTKSRLQPNLFITVVQIIPDAVIDPKKKNNVWNGEGAKPAPLQADLRVNGDGVVRWKVC
tara:strand:- start:1270 stop:1467 length:198 start_codon:yes stop_codon:yes gene_type:complete